jgi:hypothetical protein
MKKVITVRNLEDTLNLKEQLAEVTNVGVIGSGVLGCEIASAISASGKKVTILDQILAPNLPMSGGRISEKIKELFIDNKVEMRLGIGVQAISEAVNNNINSIDSSAQAIVMGSGNVIGSGLKGMWIGDNLTPTDDGIIVPSMKASNAEFGVVRFANLPTFESDRDYIEKSKRAFVSFIRSYKEHDLKFIF